MTAGNIVAAIVAICVVLITLHLAGVIDLATWH